MSTTSDSNEITFAWLEHGGPPVETPESRDGFGSTLIKRAVVGQLGGTIDYDWRAEGLVVTLRIDRERLSK